MEKALFRIGGVYLNGNGDFIRMAELCGDAKHDVGFYAGTRTVRVERVDSFGHYLKPHGYCRLDNGVNWRGGTANLQPEEIWFQPRQKVAPVIAEQPRAPYFAEAVEQTPALVTDEGVWFITNDFTDLVVGPDAAMIARDGPVKPTVAPPPVAQEATSHAPLAGLTVLMERDHRFGLFRF